MKNLLLVRHGKSSWNFPGLSDHDRPLNDRGKRDAPNIGAALAQRGVIPDAILSSTAVRALSTARIIAGELGFPGESMVTQHDIYLASSNTLQRVIQGMDEAVNTALIVGHNPGMHELAVELSGGESIKSFPTLSVARLELNVVDWSEARPGCGLLIEHLYPRMLSDSLHFEA